MRIIHRMRASLIIIIMAFAGFGCSTNSSDSGSATINGSVEGNSQKQKAAVTNVEGAVVTAAKVTANGSIETIKGAETQTNASGEFTLDVDVESAQHILIVAEKEGTEWKGFLTAAAENGNTIQLKPLNSETTAESAVYTEIVSSAKADIVQKSDIEAVVTAEIASEINGQLMATETVAAALVKSAEARVEFYSERFQNKSEAKLKKTYELLAEAQLRLESELAATASAEARSEAYDVFVESTANAYINAGLTASEAAEVLDIWARMAVNSMATVSSDVKNETRKQTSLIAAIAIDLAVQAEAEAANMEESTTQAIINAGTELRTAINAGAGVKADIEAAFESYHEEVKTAMENDASFNASVILTIDSEINAESGAKSEFESALSGMLNLDSVLNIYTDFFTNIEGVVQSNLSEGTNAEIEAVTQIMFLVNLAS